MGNVRKSRYVQSRCSAFVVTCAGNTTVQKVAESENDIFQGLAIQVVVSHDVFPSPLPPPPPLVPVIFGQANPSRHNASVKEETCTKPIMRLLKTHPVEIRQFGDNDIPSYAILSHRWDEEEVTFQDIVGAHAAKKRGYEKVQNSCSTAAADGFEYVWIDTCCT